MAQKLFSQTELNKIVTQRIKREREKMTKEFEKKLKRCMASVHLTIYQELCSLNAGVNIDMEDTVLSEEKKENDKTSNEKTKSC